MGILAQYTPAPEQGRFRLADYKAANPEEAAFRSWYAEQAARTGIAPNPDDPEHYYDYRAAWRAGVAPEVNPEDGRYHWPSQFKARNHPNRYVQTPDGILDTVDDVIIPAAPSGFVVGR